MNDSQRQFLDRAAAEAAKANHPFPQMAACEAALESTWGHSQLAREDFNLFGTKQHKHPAYGTINLPTREWVKGPDGHAVDGRWEPIDAAWVKYPDWAACFSDRRATLDRLASVYPHYKAALAAQDAQSYIAEVSKTWSTDPQRGAKVLSIYQEYTSPSSSASAPTAT